MKEIKKFLNKNRYWLLLFILSFAAVGSLAGAIIEVITDKKLSLNPLENFAAEQNLWLNFKFALIGGAIGFVIGITIILAAGKLKNTKVGKRIQDIFSRDGEGLFF